jgi:tetratricopeptide (TPR) repeat protein
MEVLRYAAEQAKAGRGQVVGAMAEPGVGKSRLFFEFKATSQSGWLVLDAPALSHEKATAYAPLMDLLHVYFRITPEDDARTRREKVAGKVTMLDRSLDEETLSHLFALLGIVDGVDPLAGMDEQIRQRRTQDAVKRILLRESLNQPLMLIFEDLHWIDDATQGFLNLFAEGVANAPVLLLVNYRPEYTHLWGSKTYYTQLRLDPLGEESAAAMLSARIGDSPDLAALKRLVLERTEGNPLFIEELVEALFDEGVLVRNGAVKVTRPLSQLKIPPTVQGILAARIDRLPPDAKELLQTLAVIGSEFPLALVRQVVQLPEDRIYQLLDLLQAGEFIYEQPVVSDVGYVFKHALTRDEAQKSLLTDRRKLLHERTAQAIEALYHERLEDHYTDLAYHYRSSNNAAKTIEYLRLAGGQAADRGAYTQSVANAEAALKLIERLPEGVERLRAELGMRLVQGMAVSPLYGLASTERLRTYQRVCELSERLGDISAEVQGRINVAGVYMSTEVSRGLEIMQRCVEFAQRSPGGELRAIAHLQLAILVFYSGDPVQASSLLGDLMTHFEPARRDAGSDYLPINPWVLTPTVSSWIQHTLGRPDEALKLSELALRRARELKRPFTISAAYALAAQLHFERREPEEARKLAEVAIAVAEEHGFESYAVLGRSVRAWVLAESGQSAQGISELEANATWVTGNFQIPVSKMLAQAYLRAVRAELAMGTLDEALSRAQRMGLHIYDAQLCRLKGEAILMRDSSMIAQAEECFRKGIGIARCQSAKSWELRAATSLARLLRDTNRCDEARTLLADIYNWFTEGFDTADLKDAKALLDELSN